MRQRVRKFERVRSSNPVTNIIQRHCGNKIEHTTSSQLFSNQVNTASRVMSPLRTSF